jgi:rhodanese-related sulfurtransferase
MQITDQDLRSLTAGEGSPLLRSHLAVYSKPDLPRFNCHWIADHLLAGRNPLTALDARWLIARGVTHVLDLRTPPEWAAPKFGQEALDELAGRLERRHIPVTDMGAPTPAQFAEAVDYMESVVSQPGATLYVHCRAGNERTGAILVAWHARRERITYDQALAQLQERRPTLLPLPVQEAATRRWLKAHT